LRTNRHPLFAIDQESCLLAVALQAGLSDISHFNRLFRSRFGDTPKGVRENQQAVCYAN
jgi:AraC-like DNA-binding protein